MPSSLLCQATPLPAGSAALLKKKIAQNHPHNISGKKFRVSSVCAVWVYSVSFYFFPSSLASLTGMGLLTQQNPLTSLLRVQH